MTYMMKDIYCCLLAVFLHQIWGAFGAVHVDVASSGARPFGTLPRTSSPLMAFSSTAHVGRRRGALVNIFTRKEFAKAHAADDNLTESVTSNLGEEECIADDCLLTPQIYATSDDAEHKVEDNIVSKASTAFASTDFECEPHLSPELENAEAAYEVALIATAADAFADAVEKESKQSMDAMLEREKEMSWIQDHEEGEAPYFLTPKGNGDEMSFQRALLEARLDMEKKAKAAQAKAKEKNQRALLAARFSMEKKSSVAADEAETIEERSEWMESEALAATMGAYEQTVGLARAAASSTTAHEPELDVKDAESHDNKEVNKATSRLASTAEKMILGEDIAVDVALIEDAKEHNTARQTSNEAKEESTSEIHQWRQDYIQEIRNYMQKKAVEQTKRRLKQKAMGGDSSGTASELVSENAVESTSGTSPSFKSEHNAVKRALENGLIRRMRQRRRLIITAIVMVLTRRLVLAWWGHAMRLI
jgi:hypothetical protein